MARKSKPEPEVLDMVPVDPEENEIATGGVQVLAFFKGMGAFLAKARGLETRAKEQLEVSKTWALPTSAAEDAQMQRNVLLAGDDNKEAEGLWNPVTTAFSRLHKTLTGARGRTTTMIEERKTKANGLHSAYVKAEERRVAEENERRRLKAEADAQAERDEETRKAEAEALKREAASPDLSERETIFVQAVFNGTHETQAAKTAGYKEPQQAAAKLLATPKIQKALQIKREAATIREQSAAKAAAPLHVEIEEAKPEIERAAGAKNKKKVSAKLLDEKALIAAICGGGMGIPWDVLEVKQSALNDYAESMGEKINKWPGVQYFEERGVSR